MAKNKQVFPTITQSFLDKVRAAPGRQVFHWKEGTDWKAMTWKEYYDEVRFIALGLVDLGIQAGDKGCILSNTRVEWAQADMAILGTRGVTVPIYPSSTAEDSAYIANHCEATFLFAEDNKQLEKILSVRSHLPHLKAIIVFNLIGAPSNADEKNVLSLSALKELGKRAAARDSEDSIAKNMLELKPSDVCTICYTSGTTGVPKGVVLTFDSLASEVEDIENVMGGFFSENDVILSFLPLSHIFGKVEGMAVYHFGWKVYYAESLEKLFINIAEVRPTLLFAVPRVFEKAYVRIKAAIDEASAARRRIFDRALSAGRAYHEKIWTGRHPSLIERARYEIARSVVFKKIYAKFGGRLRLCIAGGAPLPRDIGEFMQIIGIAILEGYGLTETCAAVTLNPLKRPRFGTIGRPLPEVACRIADDGEILVKSRKVMRGYYKNDEATREVIGPQGWLRTGDIGVIDDDGYVRITDRKKDIIVTSAGKNIAPQKIENISKAHKYVSQIMVYGDQRNYLTALVVLDHEETVKYAKEHNILFSEYSELVKNLKILALVQSIFDDVNSKLASHETIKKFKILHNEFSIETGELTPSMKIRRRFCSEKYRNELDSLYTAASP
ncbi:MAG: long-chain fatty acid--CoA ligase [Deltaproteobacteria bacterium]|nr:long-chain fatty acid--CoA ligase [Deltaproteobacteria bacterium]